jgi:excisionase family DNA binding protein
MQKVQPVSTGVINPADILTPKELAVRLKVRKTWVYEKLRHGRENPLPVFRIGKYLRFSWTDVSAWLRSTKRA